MESSHGRTLQERVRNAQEQVTLAKGRKENLRMFNRRLQKAEEKLENYLADIEGQQRSGKSLCVIYQYHMSYELLTPSAAFNPADDQRRASHRSRFDQAEPEVKRWSRIDRRSRTPTYSYIESTRSRSPVTYRKSSFAPLEERQRYRFDQAEPEFKHWSRIDRRSRSPTHRHTESRRSVSAVGGKSSFSAPKERELSPYARAGKLMMEYCSSERKC